MRKLFISCIRFYQKHLSKLKGRPCCRFYPTCSSYMIQAIERFGVFRGVWLGVLRILRCNPFFKGGFDPVPKRFSFVFRRRSLPKEIPGYERGYWRQEPLTSWLDITLSR